MPSTLTTSRSSSTAPERLAETVGRMMRAWIRYGKGEARRLDLMLPQLFLLGALCEDGPIAVTRWAESIGAPPSTTTGLLDGLEEKGYIVRTHDPSDRRQVLVSLSPKGRRLAERRKAQARARWSELCDGIPARELDAAAATLDRVAARMGPVPAPPSVSVPPASSRSSRPRREA